MMGLSWLVAAAIRVDNLSTISISAVVLSMYSLPIVGRREALGLFSASHDSVSSEANASMSRFRSGRSVFRSANSISARVRLAARIADCSASRVARIYFCKSGCSAASSFRLRLVLDRSVRRLCIALKRFEEASATKTIRLVVARRLHEFQALMLSNVVIQTAIRMMTDLVRGDTVKRSSIGIPEKTCPLSQ